MNKLLSYCGLVDAKIRASDKDLPVKVGQITVCICGALALRSNERASKFITQND